MSITKILPSHLIGNQSKILSVKNEDPQALQSSYYEEGRETILNKISKNFGFVIIGMMLVGAVVWTLLMWG
jgi:hypothetical protein